MIYDCYSFAPCPLSLLAASTEQQKSKQSAWVLKSRNVGGVLDRNDNLALWRFEDMEQAG